MDFEAVKEKYSLTQDEVSLLVSFRTLLEVQGFDIGRYSTKRILQFLVGKKWNIEKAVATIKRFDELDREFTIFSPDVSPLRAELETGKASFAPPMEGSLGAFLVCPFLQIPKAFPIKQTIRCFVLIVFSLLDDPKSLREGVILIGDFSKYSMANFCLEDQKMLMNIIQNCLPVRLENLFMVDAPWWMRTILAILSPFMKQKMRERIRRVSREELLGILPPAIVPQRLGGQYSLPLPALLDALATTASCR